VTDPHPPGAAAHPPLLRVEGLTASYDGARVVAEVSFDVGPGEVVALVGESGSGKSTIAHAILGLLPGNAAVDAGAIRLGDVELTALDERALRPLRGTRLGYVPQDPATSLDPVRRIGAQVEEVFRAHGLGDRRDRPGRVLDAMREAGLADAERIAGRYPHELSGGLQQRSLIAQALAGGPELIVADEPTSALDVTVQREVLDNLARATRERGVAVLLITHDLAMAAERADRVLVLRAGQLVEEGPAERVLRAPEAAYTRELVAAGPAAIPVGVARRAQAAVPDAEPVLAGEGLSRAFGASSGRRSRRDGAVRAVDEVSLSVARGRTLAVVGESGSGKTTTARILSLLETTDAGRVVLEGEDVTRARGERLRLLRRRIQYVHQNPRSALNPRLTVTDAIAEPLRAFGAPGVDARVAELLDLVALPAELAGRRTAGLSGGQAQRVAIARALALEPAVLVLDEAVSALDVSVQARVLALLADLQRRLSLAYVFVTHDLGVVAEIADEVAVMRAGRVVESGPAATVLEHPADDYTRSLLAAVPGARDVA
jgi:peptide/nickel transport system ATP-binding protein